MKEMLATLMVGLALSQTTLLYAADKPAAAPVPPPVSEQVRYDLALLAEHGLLAEPDAWAERLLTRPHLRRRSGGRPSRAGGARL